LPSEIIPDSITIAGADEGCELKFDASINRYFVTGCGASNVTVTYNHITQWHDIISVPEVYDPGNYDWQVFIDGVPFDRYSLDGNVITLNDVRTRYQPHSIVDIILQRKLPK